MTRSRVSAAVAGLAILLLMVVGLFSQRTFTPGDPSQPPVISPFAWQIAAQSSDLLRTAQTAAAGLPDCSTRECSDGLTDPLRTISDELETAANRLALDASVTPECRSAAQHVQRSAEQLTWLLNNEKNAIYQLPKHIDAVRPSVSNVMEICIVEEDEQHDHDHE